MHRAQPMTEPGCRVGDPTHRSWPKHPNPMQLLIALVLRLNAGAEKGRSVRGQQAVSGETLRKVGRASGGSVRGAMPYLLVGHCLEGDHAACTRSAGTS